MRIFVLWKGSFIEKRFYRKLTTASRLPKIVLVLIISPCGELIRNDSEVLEITGTLHSVFTETDAIDSASNEKVFVDIVQFCCLPGDK